MSKTVDNDVLAEYDFSKGVRGKHLHDLSDAYSITVHHPDQSSVTTYHAAPYFVPIDPDIQKYFPDADSVNRALRGLIALIPHAQTEAIVTEKREEPPAPQPA